MINNLFRKPFVITIGEQMLKFYSVAEFEFGLASRTTVPSDRVAELIKLSLSGLKKEAQKIKNIEKYFVALLSKSIGYPKNINRIMRELDPSLFFHDHGWRNIISALHTGGEELNEFRCAALVKYMQYLSSRQDIIKRLYMDKKKHIQSDQLKDGGPSEEKAAALLDSTIFEAAFAEKDETTAHLERMPKGESIALDLKKGEKIDLLLSKHKCKLVGGSPVLFLDQAGRKYRLEQGKNMIGRDRSSTVAMGIALRDVSRLHLIIDIQRRSSIVITDFSSHGTYIPKKYIEQNALP